MYRTILRSSAIRSRVGQRFMSSRPRLSQGYNNQIKYAIVGLSAFALFYNTSTSLIHNEVDQKKVEEGKEKALKEANPEELYQKKKESIGQAKVADKVPAEETTPVTKNEVEEGEQTGEDQGEGEGHQSAAFNPETGEINWDCPCLGGMAHGPCGEEFKEAFSCFVYSESEPKGIDCVQKFQNMRTCFKQHPEHYKEELYEDDNAEEQAIESSSTSSEEKQKLVEGTEAVGDEVKKEVSN